VVKYLAPKGGNVWKRDLFQILEIYQNIKEQEE
jgi:hypothetical protein